MTSRLLTYLNMKLGYLLFTTHARPEKPQTRLYEQADEVQLHAKTMKRCAPRPQAAATALVKQLHGKECISFGNWQK